MSFFIVKRKIIMSLNYSPDNVNPLHPNKFQVNFSMLPHVQFFAQMVTIPGVSMNEIMSPTPFVDMPVPGDKLLYDILTITFIVDEEMRSWQEIHKWLRGMTFPTNFSEYRGLKNINRPTLENPNKRPQYSDCMVTVLSSSNTPLIRFKYYDVFPTSLSTITLNTSDSPDTVITADVTFRYTYFDIENRE